MTRSPVKCICLVAPTASGKTALSLRLAEHLPLEIVSMDSAMVYRGMDIGTAKPTRRERGAVRHHLIDIADPAEAYSAGRFVADATEAIRDITARGKLALVVGGTMMYLRALRRGLAELPPADPAIRARIEADATARGWPELHARLALIDPAAAARIDPSDRQRIQRALEVHAATGRTLSALQRASTAAALEQVRTIALVPSDRVALRARIAVRFDEMLAAGLVDEVAALRRRNDLSTALPALRAVGYRQLWGHLEGHYDLDEAVRRAITATRQLAKRQLTWLRSDAADATFSSDRATTFDDVLRTVRAVTDRWS